VTGGAGYIGAHVVRVLRARGDDVLIVDDLVTGIAERNPSHPGKNAPIFDVSNTF
jgi:UDP-glucose 4-epimerase